MSHTVPGVSNTIRMTRLPGASVVSKAAVTVGALAVAATMAGCSLPPTQITVTNANNGSTLQVGVGSEISVKLIPFSIPVSSNPAVLQVTALCAGGTGGGGVTGGGGGLPIGGCLVFAHAAAPGTATLTGPSGGSAAQWHVTVHVWPNPSSGLAP